MYDFPIAGYATLTQLHEIETAAKAALAFFLTRHRPARGGSEPVLTGRFHVIARFGAAAGEIVSLFEIETTISGEPEGEGPSALPGYSWCEQSWIDFSGNYAGDSLTEILEAMDDDR